MKPSRLGCLILCSLALFVVLLAACAPSMPLEEASQEPLEAGEERAAEEVSVGEPAVEEPADAVEFEKEVQATAVPTQPLPSPTPIFEARLVELEWPSQLRLGDSDVVRLALIPSEDGYTVQADFPEHQIDQQTVEIRHLGGYELLAAARLDGVGFETSPSGEITQYLTAGETITWQWSLRPTAAGQQRLSLLLLLRWIPLEGTPGGIRETVLYSRSLDIQVRSFFGLTRSQAMTGGLVGFILGAGISLLGLVSMTAPRKTTAPSLAPNKDLNIEPAPGLSLSSTEETLLRILFRRYARLVLDREFLSGYSGARTFLVRPILSDGRADAASIVKVGQNSSVQAEFSNYERYVKDTLPPITARIQQPPVSMKQVGLGALQYTFIGAPGQTPNSLRMALLDHMDSGLLTKLFETFGPNWWMQRKPFTFRLSQEYDRVLPTHIVLEPAAGHGRPVTGRTIPETLDLKVGELVTLRDFPSIERRSDGRSQSLHGYDLPGQTMMRARWLSLSDPQGATGRVVDTRTSLLRQYSFGLDRFGLPDPIPHLPGLLAETISGSQSTIHGDLNLENILVGPGGFVWLIDFAQTRDGHTLADFAHLGAELIAHIIAPQIERANEYFDLLLTGPFDSQNPSADPFTELLAALSGIAEKCLFNPTQPQEFHIALCLACLGALKYQNLDFFQKHLLYLTAAYLCAKMDTDNF